MTATTPILIDGETYPYYALQLALSGRILPDGSADASVALRLIPTRIGVDGAEIRSEANAKVLSLGSLALADPQFQSIADAIRGTLQTYIAAKGW